MFAHRAANFDSHFFEYATNFFKFCGLWRVDSRPWWLEPYVYFSRFNVYVIFGWVFIASVLSGSLLHFKAGEVDLGLTWATFSLAWCTMQYKFVVLTRNEAKIRGLITRLEMWSSRYADKKNVAGMLEICNKLLLLGSLLIGTACVGFVCFPSLLGEVRTLPIKTMFTFGLDVVKSPTFEIYVVYQNVGTLVNTVVAISFDTVYIGILLTTAALLRNLNAQMRKDMERTELGPGHKYRLLIKHIVEQNEILKHLNEVRELFMTSNLLHFLYNYTNAGLTMFQVSKLPIGSIQFFAILSGFSSEIYGLMTYCESGQKITDEMREFWKNLYFSDWQKESMKFRKTIQLSLLQTQKEYSMSAGKMMTLSRETEKSILNAIFTYYTFLHRLNKS